MKTSCFLTICLILQGWSGHILAAGEVSPAVKNTAPAAPVPGAGTGAVKPIRKSTKKPKKKSPPPPTEPADPVPVYETTKIEPALAYRLSGLKLDKESVYYKDTFGDMSDQIYITLLFRRTYNYAHEVVIEPSLRTLRNNPNKWEDYVIEQAYVESSLVPSLSVTAGKKAEFEGSGFLVQPSDLLNESRDVFDPLYQKEGQVFVRLKYQPGEFTLGVGAIPKRGEASKQSRAWLHAGGEVLGIDMRLQVTTQESEKTTTGLSLQRFFGESFGLHFDGRYQNRQRVVSAEGNEYLGYSAYIGKDPDSQADDDPSAYYVAGTRFVLTPRRTLVAEYITNESGLMPEDFERMYEKFRADREESAEKVRQMPWRLQGRHYGFVSYQDDDTLEGLHLRMAYLLNTDDQSSFTMLTFRYVMSPISSLELTPTFYTGKRDTEFGEALFDEAHYLIFRGKF